MACRKEPNPRKGIETFILGITSVQAMSCIRRKEPNPRKGIETEIDSAIRDSMICRKNLILERGLKQ